jgi:2'-5' RNA ligase
VDVPARVRDEVASATDDLRRAAPEARWADPGSWHLTLAFLGATAPARAAAIVSALEPVAARTPSFTLALDGTAGRFGQRVLWAGIERSVVLQELATAVQQALEPMGFPPESRPFHAHLTLARSRGEHPLPKGLEQRYEGPRESWRVDDLTLMRSELRRQGARYRAEHRFPLGG